MRFCGVLLLMGASWAAGQNVPAARQALELSVFGGVSGVFTGIGPNEFAIPVTVGTGGNNAAVFSVGPAGRNLSITGAADVVVRPFFGFSPGIEVRGMYPVDNGSVAGERNLVGGLTLGRRVRFARVYGDFLVGRGEIDYDPPFLDTTGAFLYVKTFSTVLSPGGGVEIDLSRHFGLRGDVQYQRYAAPVPAGHAWSTPVTAGLVYRFDFNRAPGLPNR